MRRGFYSVAVVSSVVSIVLGMMYWAARIGFVTPVLPVASAVGVGLILINVPVLLTKYFGSEEDTAWYRSHSVFWLATLAIVAAVGRFSSELSGSPAPAFALLGAVAFVAVVGFWLRTVSALRAVALIAGSAFFATWAGGVVWGRIYKSPLFFEMLISNGIVHHDGVTLAALSNMLRTYHAASMGLDGLSPYMAYHWGTPWLFAQLSNLTAQSPLEFYQLGYPLTFIPLFFGSVMTFGTQLSGRDITREKLPWILLIAASIGVFPITGMDALGVWTSNLMISESYAVGIPVLLMLMATTITFWRRRGNAVLTGNGRTDDYAYLALGLAMGLSALGYIKISMMILGFAALGWAALRIGAWKRPPLFLIGAWIAVAVFLTYERTSLVAHREGVVPLDFLKAYVPIPWWPYFILTQLFWSLLYIVLRLRQDGARTLGDVTDLARAKKIIDVEVVAVVAVAGLLPGFVLHIDGGSAFYFSDVQRWISLALLVTAGGVLFRRTSSVPLSPLAKVAIAFVALPLVVSTARNSVYWTTRMLKANAELRHSLYPAEERDRIVPGIRSLPRLTNSAKLEDGLRRSPNFNPVNGLLELSKLPISEKRSMAVFVPQSETAYWSILKRSNACPFGGHVVPSLTGMAMVDGMPSEKCKLSPYYGLSLYEKRARPQTSDDASPQSVCSEASRHGFRKVMMLDFDAEGRASRKVIDCPQA